MADYDGTGVEYFDIPQFEFVNGAKLDVKVAYREFNKGAEKSVLIPTCYGGRINTTLNFHTSALKNYHITVVAMLGNGESTSSSNEPNFPKDLRYADCINAQYALVTKHLHLRSLDAVIGFSMGGQQAYHWAVMHGSSSEPFVKNIVAICTSAKTSGHNIAFLEGPICALEQSHDYVIYEEKVKGGMLPEEAMAKCPPIWGIRSFGRAYAAWLTSMEWFSQELWKSTAGSLREWLCPWEFGGESRFMGWNPDDLLVLAQMWQAGDVGTVGGNGDWKEALRGIKSRVMVMPSTTDQYFRWESSKEELPYLQNGVWAPIETVWGHIAGGGANPVDTDFMDKKIGEFLQG